MIHKAVLSVCVGEEKSNVDANTFFFSQECTICAALRTERHPSRTPRNERTQIQNCSKSRTCERVCMCHLLIYAELYNGLAVSKQEMSNANMRVA